MDVNQTIVKVLEDIGVKHVFGGSGQVNASMLLALRDSKKIKTVIIRNEQAASFMACGYTMFNPGNLGVCFATGGPGAFNLFSGMAVALSDSLPLLAITGYTSMSQRGKGALYKDSPVRLVVNTGDGTMAEVNAGSLVLPHAIAIARCMMTFHLAVNDLKELADYVSTGSLKNATLYDSKINVNATYGMNGNTAVATCRLWSTMNAYAYTVKMDFVSIDGKQSNIDGKQHKLQISVVNNLGNTQARCTYPSADKTNLLDDGKKLLRTAKDKREKGFISNIISKMITLSDTTQSSTSKGEIIQQRSNSVLDRATERVRPRQDALFKEMSTVREAVMNTFGDQLTDGGRIVGNLFAVTDRKEANIGVEFTIRGGGSFNGIYVDGKPVVYCTFDNATSAPIKLAKDNEGKPVLPLDFLYWYLIVHGTNVISQKAIRMMQRGEDIPSNVERFMLYGVSQISEDGIPFKEDMDEVFGVDGAYDVLTNEYGPDDAAEAISDSEYSKNLSFCENKFAKQ